MCLKQFKEMLDQGAISIGQSDQFGKPLRQFDEVQYGNEVYLVIWHPIYREFVGSHESGIGFLILIYINLYGLRI